MIPAYNEEKTIGKVIIGLNKVGLKSIVIDDGSSDRTCEISKSFGIIVLRHAENKGKGEAIKTGLKYIYENYPKTNYVIFLDADLQYNPIEAQGLLNYATKSNSDIVMGYRDWSKVPFRHKIGNIVWRIAFNFLFGTNLKDTNCGFVVAKTDSIKQIKIHGGYIIENSILSQAAKKGFKIGQFKVSINYRSKSKTIRGIKMVFGVLLYIVKTGLLYRLNKR